jgi:chromosome partitioning protein
MSSKPVVISITNLKGGTGKTTLSALLGYGLARMGRKVLLIDLDPESHLTSMFVPINEIENVAGGSMDFATIGSSYRVRTVYNDGRGQIDLLPSGLNYIIRIFEGSIPAWDSHAIEVRIEKELKGRYDYVICDTPPEVIPPTMWALFASDYVVLPTNLEELSLAGLKILVRYILPSVFERSKRSTKVLGVTLVNITRHWKRETLARIENDIANYIISTSPQVAERTYRKIFFNTSIHRHAALRDLMYEPRRWQAPLFKYINMYANIREEVESLAKEVEARIANFEPLLPRRLP